MREVKNGIRHIFVFAPTSKLSREIYGRYVGPEEEPAIFHYDNSPMALRAFGRQWAKERCVFLFDSRSYTLDNREYRNTMREIAEEAMQRNLTCIFIDDEPEARES
jgi:hypothetical protein